MNLPSGSLFVCIGLYLLFSQYAHFCPGNIIFEVEDPLNDYGPGTTFILPMGLVSLILPIFH